MSFCEILIEEPGVLLAFLPSFQASAKTSTQSWRVLQLHRRRGRFARRAGSFATLDALAKKLRDIRELVPLLESLGRRTTPGAGRYQSACALLGYKVESGSPGGLASWIDDIAMHADSFNGFVELFGMMLARIAFASMQLKASKCFLLHESLEVLGFFVTPDGITLRPHKIEDLVKRDAKGEFGVPVKH